MCAEFSHSSSPENQIEVMLDGQPIGVPPQRRSLAAIRSYLESCALEQQRILWSFSVEGDAAGSAEGLSAPGQLLRVRAQTIGLDQMPVQVVENAMLQTARAHAQVQRAVADVMINEAARGHELWWSLNQELKLPLLTLSLLPEAVCGPANGSASMMQLRRWQLQQLAGIIQQVDLACQSNDPTPLSDALEHRVLPWLEGLQQTLALLHPTLLAAQEIAYREALGGVSPRQPAPEHNHS